MIDLNFTCRSINSIDPNNANELSIDLRIHNSDVNDILDQIGVEKIYNYIDIDKMLDLIGKDYCKEYFDLIEED